MKRGNRTAINLPGVLVEPGSPMWTTITTSGNSEGRCATPTDDLIEAVGDDIDDTAELENL